MTGAGTQTDAVFFDLFGTLLSLGPLSEVCERLSPGRGEEIATRWRARQLEASWLRTAMGRWVDFDVVTMDALRGTLEELAIAAPDDLEAVADGFAELPLVDGAADTIGRIREAGISTGILTNASARTLERTAARLEIEFDHRLSVDRARQFKPHPDVYRLVVAATGLPPERIGFVTANGWDAAGAGAFGFRVAWLRPSQSATLPSVGAPSPRVASWQQLPDIFA